MADYGTLQDHADVMLELLRDDVELVVYPAESGGPTIVPPGALPPYVSVHFVADTPLGGQLDHRSTRMRVRAYAHCVGANDIAARAVSDRVRTAWLDVRPVIDGRVVYPIRNEVGRDPTANEATGAGTVVITDTYRLETTPGRGGS
jgi:hypothetical protein